MISLYSAAHDLAAISIPRWGAGTLIMATLTHCLCSSVISNIDIDIKIQRCLQRSSLTGGFQFLLVMGLWS